MKEKSHEVGKKKSYFQCSLCMACPCRERRTSYRVSPSGSKLPIPCCSAKAHLSGSLGSIHAGMDTAEARNIPTPGSQVLCRTELASRRAAGPPAYMLHGCPPPLHLATLDALLWDCAMSFAPSTGRQVSASPAWLRGSHSPSELSSLCLSNVLRKGF